MLAVVLIGFIVLDRFIDIKENNKLIITAGILIGIIAVSFAFGTDYLSYEYIYKHASFNSVGELERIEPGFMTLIYLSRAFNLPYHVFSLIIRSFILIVTLKWIQDNSEDPLQSLILYFAMFYVVWTMSALRQGMALAISLYFIFNKKKEISLFHKVLILCGAALFHSSVLAVIPILLLSELKWNRKRHLIFLSIGLLFTLLPVHLIFEKLSFLPLVSTIVLYLSPNFGFFDFSSFIRLFFFGLVLWNYKYLAGTSKKDKVLVDVYLIGTPLYFFLKSSELTAGRINIYTFVILILLLPKIFKKVSNVSFGKFKIPATLILASFSLLFLSKELKSYNEQVGYSGNKSIYSVSTIFNKNYGEFDNIYAFLESELIQSEQDYADFKKTIEQRQVIKYDPSDTFIIAQDPNSSNYGVLSNTGDWIRSAKMKRKPSIQGDILIESVKQDLISQNFYTDLSMSTKDQDDLFNRAAEYAKTYYSKNVTSEQSIEGDFFTLLENPEAYVKYPENVKKSRAVRLENNDVVYHVVYLQYYHYDLYIYLDENLVPFNERVYTTLSRYNAEGFLEAKDRFGTSLFNKEGDLIWMIPFDDAKK